ncbi:unnamed protein product [Notodromas monacha]|uniref:Uncharacterized protein n=1 Tax=Notodromas monacha TaxID=399045 RepID=A0A7R9BT85_9CRUS|nr:unnamed protein product [Notodromas monacha]CAG0920249.1 unnamed protein product [Notodromas monacha]
MGVRSRRSHQKTNEVIWARANDHHASQSAMDGRFLDEVYVPMSRLILIFAAVSCISADTSGGGGSHDHAHGSTAHAPPPQPKPLGEFLGEPVRLLIPVVPLSFLQTAPSSGYGVPAPTSGYGPPAPSYAAAAPSYAVPEAPVHQAPFIGYEAELAYKPRTFLYNAAPSGYGKKGGFDKSGGYAAPSYDSGNYVFLPLVFAKDGKSGFEDGAGEAAYQPSGKFAFIPLSFAKEDKDYAGGYDSPEPAYGSGGTGGDRYVFIPLSINKGDKGKKGGSSGYGFEGAADGLGFGKKFSKLF